ncbi:MAG: isoprenylcysteine carboxylmethyltransferase family protein [Paracoccus sp. (in: a-proteobacteria)]|uniref:methyltransferase family protein n=1 Tax=Paracoccus sp. TaxID=267 RepID=UPI0026DF988A|nr:isoprenylcysteine carboxylmethyltransferase family protein [Paracoccus sp. (in: a-proteobacteria)]MDO5631487.1 isoprenylcysteine carboxylmethyltransferase family protein [Paracoccus sp. (in: a-proteobacteria)]
MQLTADYPKVWLLGGIALAWLAGRTLPHGPTWPVGAGWLLAFAGLVLLAAAALQMRRTDTPSDPHALPRALVTDGLFALSRNPIYLADALILTGLCAAFGAPLAALVLTPAFVAVITTRFIRTEEARLATAFGPAFSAYCARTRRWL